MKEPSRVITAGTFLPPLSTPPLRPDHFIDLERGDLARAIQHWAGHMVKQQPLDWVMCGSAIRMLAERTK
jgi:hypothetical protein